MLIRASGQSTNSTDSGSVFHVDLSSMQWGGLSEADLAVDLHGYEHFIDGEAHAPMRNSRVIDGSYLTTSKPRVWWGTGPCSLANAKGPTGGALVGCLYEGSPAKISGLQLGDEIMTIDDAPITNWNQIRTFIINTANPGRNFTVTVIRAGKRVTFDSYIIGLDNASLAKMQALGVSYYKPAPAHL